MKEEQEGPKIRIKVRKVEDFKTEQDFQDKNMTNSENGLVTSKKQPISKIVMRKNLEENLDDEEKTAKKRTFFRISAIVLTVLLVVAIVVECAVMLWLKSSTEELKNKNDRIPKEQTSISSQI